MKSRRLGITRSSVPVLPAFASDVELRFDAEMEQPTDRHPPGGRTRPAQPEAFEVPDHDAAVARCAAGRGRMIGVQQIHGPLLANGLDVIVGERAREPPVADNLIPMLHEFALRHGGDGTKVVAGYGRRSE
jgi:hypothetical protein